MSKIPTLTRCYVAAGHVTNFGLHFGLTMTHIFAPFTVIFIVLRKPPLLFVKQKMRLPTGSKITDREILKSSKTAKVQQTPSLGGRVRKKVFGKKDLTDEVWVNLSRSPPGEVFGFVENIKHQLERKTILPVSS